MFDNVVFHFGEHLYFMVFLAKVINKCNIYKCNTNLSDFEDFDSLAYFW